MFLTSKVVQINPKKELGLKDHKIWHDTVNCEGYTMQAQLRISFLNYLLLKTIN